MNEQSNFGFDNNSESNNPETQETETIQNPEISKGIEQIRLGFVTIANLIETGQVEMNDLSFVTHYCLDLLLLVHVQVKKQYSQQTNSNEESI